MNLSHALSAYSLGCKRFNKRIYWSILWDEGHLLYNESIRWGHRYGVARVFAIEKDFLSRSFADSGSFSFKFWSASGKTSEAS